MENISDYIYEKLRITKDTINDIEPTLIELASDEEYVKKIDSKKKYYFEIPGAEDVVKMKDYFNKGSKPSRLVNSIKNFTKMQRRFVCACKMKWEDAIEEFGNALIERYKMNKDSVIYAISMYMK